MREARFAPGADAESAEKVPSSERKEKKPTKVVTAQGSVYRYLPDGRTQRFKTKTGELDEPQDTIVFIPTFDLVGAKAAELYPEIFRGIENSLQFEQVLLEYSQLHGRTIRVIDENSTELHSNKAVQNAGHVFAQFIDRNDGKNCFTLPVSKVPKVGYLTFDTRKFHDENGELKRERHIGNAVVDIKYAEE
jgi:hypothetical protein